MAKVSIIVPMYNAENRLPLTLKSIQEQTLKDIEVLLVDDASKDKTVSIAEEWCRKDPRFHLIRNEKNSGVSVSRNKGMDHATGEFIRFVDSDDTIPEDSTERMLRIAEQKDSDLVIGMIRRESAVRSYLFRDTIVLAEKEEMDRYDENLIYSFSVCNKMFRRSLLEKYKIRFENYAHAEDGLFTFTVLSRVERGINGCGCEVYNYFKNELMEGSSSTDHLTKEKLEGVLEISEKILMMNPYAPIDFIHAFIERIIKVTLLNEYYRKIWWLDKETEAILYSTFERLWGDLPNPVKKKIRKMVRNLELQDHLFSKDELLESPLFTIAIRDTVSKEHLPRLITSVYAQDNPRFVLVVDRNLEPFVPESMKAYQNLQFAKEKEDVFQSALEHCKSRYICFVEDDILFHTNTLIAAYNNLENGREYVSGYVNFNLVASPQHQKVYDFLFSDTSCRKNNETFDDLDFLLSNKVFSVSAMRKKGFCFSGDPAKDLKRMQAVFPHERTKTMAVSSAIEKEQLKEKEQFVSSLESRLASTVIRKTMDECSRNELKTYVKHYAFHAVKNKVLFVGKKGKLKGAAKKIYDRIRLPKELAPASVDKMSAAERSFFYGKYRLVVFQEYDQKTKTAYLHDDQTCLVLLNALVKTKEETNAAVSLIEQAFQTEKGKKAGGFSSAIRQMRKRLYMSQRIQKKVFRKWNRICCKFFRVKKNSVLFLSDIRTELGGDLAAIAAHLPEGFVSHSCLCGEKWTLTKMRSYLQLIYRMSVSQYLILEDLFQPLSYFKPRQGQEICQLWHTSASIEKFAHGADPQLKPKIHKGYKKYTKVIASSDTTRNIFARAFLVPKYRVQATGIPETDRLLDSDLVNETRERFFCEHPELRGKKIVLFAPACRGEREEEAYYDYSGIDLKQLYETLGEQYALLFKWHSNLYRAIESGVSRSLDLSDYPDFALDMGIESDIHDLMIAADILVTDYSFVMFDYSLLNKPIVYYVRDRESYEDKKKMYFPFEDFTYGPVVTVPEALPETIRNAKTDPERLQVFRKRFMNACDGHASERAADWLFKNKLPFEIEEGIDFSVIYYAEKGEKRTSSKSLESISEQTIGKEKIQLISASGKVSFDGTSIFLEKKEGECLPALLNRCLEQVQGKYVLFLREGDIWKKDAFKKAKKYIEKHKKEADVFVCRTDLKKLSEPVPSSAWMTEERSNIVDLQKDYEKRNLIEGNAIYLARDIRDKRFDPELETGFLSAFYQSAVLEQLYVGYIADSVFCPAASSSIEEWKKTALDAEQLSNFLSHKEWKLVNESNRFYSKTVPFVQNLILEDFVQMQPEEQTLPATDRPEAAYGEIIYSVLGIMKKKPFSVFRNRHAELGSFFNYLKKYNNTDSAGEKEPFLRFIEKKNTIVIVLRMKEGKLHLDGKVMFGMDGPGEPLSFYAKDESGNTYPAELDPDKEKRVVDYQGVMIAKGFDYSLELPSSVGKDFTFFLRNGEEEREITPVFGYHTNLSKGLSEARVRDSKTVIRRTKGGFCVSEPSKEMKKRLQFENEDTKVRDVVAFVSVRGEKLQENMQMVKDALSDLPQVTFGMKRPLSVADTEKAWDIVFHSKVVVTDDYLWLFREREVNPGQKVVQLWHACGAIKKFGINGTTMFPAVDSMTHQYYDAVTISSAELAPIYAHSFAISPDKVFGTGVPRTDVFFDPAYIQKTRSKVFATCPQLEGKKILMYTPTFRDLPDRKRDTFIPELDFDYLSQTLAEDQIFVICPHPVMTTPILNKEYSNILEIREITTLEMMFVADLMITDYSSVIFEFALLHKPMAFFCYDYDSYDRDFDLDYEHDLPGEILRNQDELYAFIRKNDYSLHKEYDRFIEKYMGGCDGHSTERVADKIRELFHS